MTDHVPDPQLDGERDDLGDVVELDEFVGWPHLGLGPVTQLVAEIETVVGRWPSLITDTGRLTFQLDLHPDLPDDQAVNLVQQFSHAVAVWASALEASAGRAEVDPASQRRPGRR